MDLNSLISENKWLFEILYALIISLISMTIFLKTDKIFKISLHKGVRYFRNAFFYYGLAFICRYVFGLFTDFSLSYSFLIQILFEYFLVIAGFSLLYSLIWKKFESPSTRYLTSLFNSKTAIFHFLAFVIAIIDSFFGIYYLMFFSQIITFLITTIISFFNYKKNGEKRKFLKLYFIAMILGFTAWTLNLLAAMFFHWYKGLLIDIGLVNIIFFLLFLYGVLKVTQK